MYTEEDSEETGSVEEGVAGGEEMVEGSACDYEDPRDQPFVMQASKWFDWVKELQEEEAVKSWRVQLDEQQAVLSKPEALTQEGTMINNSNFSPQAAADTALPWLSCCPKVDGVTFLTG